MKFNFKTKPGYDYCDHRIRKTRLEQARYVFFKFPQKDVERVKSQEKAFTHPYIN